MLILSTRLVPVVANRPNLEFDSLDYFSKMIRIVLVLISGIHGLSVDLNIYFSVPVWLSSLAWFWNLSVPARNDLLPYLFNLVITSLFLPN